MNQSDPVGEEKAMSFEEENCNHPIDQAEVLRFINDTPMVFSLLYDLDLLPEQLDRKGPNWIRMLNIGLHMKLLTEKLEAELAKLKEELADAQKYTCKIVAGPAVDALRAERDALKAALVKIQGLCAQMWDDPRLPLNVGEISLTATEVLNEDALKKKEKGE